MQVKTVRKYKRGESIGKSTKKILNTLTLDKYRRRCPRFLFPIKNPQKGINIYSVLEIAKTDILNHRLKFGVFIKKNNPLLILLTKKSECFYPMN
ncbi:hypothetical protein [Neobacillus bataviensis]|uniref:hypothetical protein n=1 Tax=Neobacillus bataviensis TaxID=220685 RepID=UPI001CBE482E|nr:hypothetical protein [Neobacillus bataviensis]